MTTPGMRSLEDCYAVLEYAMKTISCCWVIFFLAFVGTGCGPTTDFSTPRHHRGKNTTGPIIIGAAAPWSKEAADLKNGIELALMEVNAGGGIMGRPIDVFFRDDQGLVHQGKQIAAELVNRPDVVAVIGHYTSRMTVAVAPMYQFNGMLMIVPTATAPALTEQGFHLVFRNIPTDAVFGQVLADYAVQQGYRHVIVYYLRDAYGMGLVNSFEQHARSRRIQVVDRRGFEPGPELGRFQRDVGDWKQYYRFDAIVLAALMPEAAQIVTKLRQEAVSAPILAGGGLDDPEFLRIAGTAAEGVFLASSFSEKNTDSESVAFTLRYRKQYGKDPDKDAAQGYDALKLLTYAMEQARSSEPEKIAAVLKKTRNWVGVTGLHTFNEKGDVPGKALHLKIVRQGRFELLGKQF